MEEKVEKNPTQSEKQKEKRIIKNGDSLRDFWGNMKHYNICIRGVPEGEEREEDFENLFEEIMTEGKMAAK